MLSLSRLHLLDAQEVGVVRVAGPLPLHLVGRVVDLRTSRGGPGGRAGTARCRAGPRASAGRSRAPGPTAGRCPCGIGSTGTLGDWAATGAAAPRLAGAGSRAYAAAYPPTTPTTSSATVAADPRHPMGETLGEPSSCDSGTSRLREGVTSRDSGPMTSSLYRHPDRLDAAVAPAPPAPTTRRSTSPRRRRVYASPRPPRARRRSRRADRRSRSDDGQRRHRGDRALPYGIELGVTYTGQRRRRADGRRAGGHEGLARRRPRWPDGRLPGVLDRLHVRIFERRTRWSTPAGPPRWPSRPAAGTRWTGRWRRPPRRHRDEPHARAGPVGAAGIPAAHGEDLHRRPARRRAGHRL